MKGVGGHRAKLGQLRFIMRIHEISCFPARRGQVSHPFAVLFNDVFASCSESRLMTTVDSVLDLSSHLCTIYFILQHVFLP